MYFENDRKKLKTASDNNKKAINPDQLQSAVPFKV